MPGIRKPTFDQDKADVILRAIASGKTEKEALSEPGMPDQNMVWSWREDNALFRLAYARARLSQTRSWADDLVMLSRDGSGDWIETVHNGQTVTKFNRDHFERTRLRLDSLKWLMARINATEFGDKQDGRVEPLKDIQPVDLIKQISSIMIDLGAALSDEQKEALAKAMGSQDD